MSSLPPAQTSSQNRYLTCFALGCAAICSLGVAMKSEPVLFLGPVAWGFLLSWPASRPSVALPRWKFSLALFVGAAAGILYAMWQGPRLDSPHSAIWVGGLAVVPFIWLFNRGKKLPLRPAAATVSPATSPVASESGPARKVVSQEEFQRLKQLQRELFDGPRSQRMAVMAAGLRAAELEQSQEKIEATQRAAYKSWQFPEGANLQEQSEQVSDHWLKWAGDNFHGAASQNFAVTAAVLRSLELGQSQDQAMEAGGKAAKAWARPANLAAHQQQAAKPDLLAAPAGKTRGIAAGLLKRTVPFMIPYRLGRTPSYVDKVVWSFSLQRVGKGANGRPLSPVPCQIEGYEVLGALEDGDVVEIDGEPPAATLMTLITVRNISKAVDVTSTPVKSSPEYQGARFISYAVMALVLIVMALFVGAFLTNANHHF